MKASKKNCGDCIHLEVCSFNINMDKFIDNNKNMVDMRKFNDRYEELHKRLNAADFCDFYKRNMAEDTIRNKTDLECIIAENV